MQQSEKLSQRWVGVDSIHHNTISTTHGNSWKKRCGERNRKTVRHGNSRHLYTWLSNNSFPPHDTTPTEDNTDRILNHLSFFHNSTALFCIRHCMAITTTTTTHIGWLWLIRRYYVSVAYACKIVPRKIFKFFSGFISLSPASRALVGQQNGHIRVVQY